MARPAAYSMDMIARETVSRSAVVSLLATCSSNRVSTNHNADVADITRSISKYPAPQHVRLAASLPLFRATTEHGRTHASIPTVRIQRSEDELIKLRRVISAVTSVHECRMEGGERVDADVQCRQTRSRRHARHKRRRYLPPGMARKMSHGS